ncbi:MAG: hypothetical protein H6Q86_3338 [candidate division NC10 bacterium]|nr:hypothetical protein [candidate division NC10 bacterium]
MSSHRNVPDFKASGPAYTYACDLPPNGRYGWYEM